MGAAKDFTFTKRKNGDVAITHQGRIATILRGKQAEKFLLDIASDDPQLIMAKATGNYKRGNERHARMHPRRKR